MERVECKKQNDLFYHMDDDRIRNVLSEELKNDINSLLEYNQILKQFGVEGYELENGSTEKLLEIRAHIYKTLNIEKYEFDTLLDEVLKENSYLPTDLILFLKEYNEKIFSEEICKKILLSSKFQKNILLDLKIFNDALNILWEKDKEVILKNKCLLEGLLEKITDTNNSKRFDIDINLIINEYLKLNAAHHILSMIITSKNREINAVSRVNCKKRLNNYYSNEQNWMKYSYEFSYNKDYQKVFEPHYEGEKLKYSEKWNFSKGLNYINRYFSIFDFMVNDLGLLQKKSISTAHYKQGGLKSSQIGYADPKFFTTKNDGFERKNNLLLRRISLFICYLKEQNISIYQVINYIIENSLGAKFYLIDGSEGYYNYDIGTINKHLCVQIDNLLSQYECLVKYNEIDRELVLYDTDSVRIEKIESKKTKNYYPKNFIFFHLMNEQSFLISSPIQNLPSNHNTLYEQIKCKCIAKSNIDEFHDNIINQLITLGYCKFNEEILEFSNSEILPYIEYMYNNGSISSLLIPDEIIEIMEELNLIRFDNQLFDEYECDYFNFVYNNQEFNDNYAIRNKYLHTGHIDMDEEQANLLLIKLTFEIMGKIYNELSLN